VSSGWCSNCSTTSFAAYSTPAWVASSISMMGPCTTGSREIWGSHLWKLVNTYSATAFARAWPSASSWPLQTSSTFRVKKWERGADLLHRIPDAEGTEVEGHQCNLNLAQEVPNFLYLTCPGCLELLLPAMSGSQLLKLPFRQLLLLFYQPLLPVH
jgi:hypothetical protein